MLTHIVNGKDSTLLVVDEPEIYLHPDVQRQLVGILRELECDVVMATHSPEIIGEADPSEIILVDKKKRSGQRLRDVESVQAVLTEIGSSQNITLTRLARNRRVVFVEDEYDFVVLRRFALEVGYTELAAGTEITAVASGGFSSWERVQALGWGIGRTLGQELAIAVVYDRDYWCDEEVAEVLDKLKSTVSLAHIHRRKEIENYLLIPSVLTQAFTVAIKERRRRVSGDERTEPSPAEDISEILDKVSVPMRTKAQSQYVARRTDFLRKRHSKLDSATIAAETMEMFDLRWQSIDTRMEIVPGKEVLRAFRQELHSRFSINLTDHQLVSAFSQTDIPSDLRSLLDNLEKFRQLDPRDFGKATTPPQSDVPGT